MYVICIFVFWLNWSIRLLTCCLTIIIKNLQIWTILFTDQHCFQLLCIFYGSQWLFKLDAVVCRSWEQLLGDPWGHLDGSFQSFPFSGQPGSGNNIGLINNVGLNKCLNIYIYIYKWIRKHKTAKQSRKTSVCLILSCVAGKPWNPSSVFLDWL